MKKLIAFLLALLLLPAMTGCSAMLEREYSSQTPHAEQEPPPEANFTLEADTYQKLVIGILYFVNRHMETGTIRFSNFEGDIDEAVQTACLEVTRSDPIGAFVVDYITSDVVRIVSYYEADLTIVYKHPQEDVINMIPVAGSLTMKREIGSVLERFTDKVIFYNTGFAGDDSSVEDMVKDAYYDNPEAAMGFPDISVKLYPEEGFVRVIEIRLAFSAEQADLILRRNTVLDTAQRIAESFAGQPERQIARQFCSSLHEMAAPTAAEDGSVPASTAWDVLVEGQGGDEGFALAYKLLCDQAGLTCTVVRGSMNGTPHFWNIVTLDENSYHVDSFSENSSVYFCSDETFVQLGYNWNPEEYPACDADLNV